MTDPERARFVEWFTKKHGTGGCPECAELAAECIERAVRADREWMQQSAIGFSKADAPIPWAAAMEMEDEE